MQTDPIMESQAVVLAKPGHNQMDRIAVAKQGMLFDVLVKGLFPESEVVLCDTIQECMQKVLAGKADCTLIPASQLNSLRQYEEFNELEFHDSNVKLSICMYIMKGNAGLFAVTY